MSFGNISEVAGTTATTEGILLPNGNLPGCLSTSFRFVITRAVSSSQASTVASIALQVKPKPLCQCLPATVQGPTVPNIKPLELVVTSQVTLVCALRRALIAAIASWEIKPDDKSKGVDRATGLAGEAKTCGIWAEPGCRLKDDPTIAPAPAHIRTANSTWNSAISSGDRYNREIIVSRYSSIPSERTKYPNRMQLYCNFLLNCSYTGVFCFCFGQF